MRRLNMFNQSKNHRGVGLPAILLFLVVMAAFMGMVVYTGTTSFVQEELQKAVGTASLVGASSLWDGDTDLLPAASPGAAEEAARQAWNHQVEGSSLQSLGATLETLNVTGQRVRVDAFVEVPISYLAPYGLDSLRVEASGTAQYVIETVEGFPGTLQQAGCGGGGNTTVQGDLRVPLTDKPGPDLIVRTNSLRGYHVMACNLQGCHDVSGGARVLPGGRLRIANQDGTERTTIYGSAVIDLAAISSTYGGGAIKATSIQIIDDGVPDRIEGGQRRLEVCPQPLTITQVQALHHAQPCTFGGTLCPLPDGFTEANF